MTSWLFIERIFDRINIGKLFFYINKRIAFLLDITLIDFNLLLALSVNNHENNNDVNNMILAIYMNIFNNYMYNCHFTFINIINNIADIFFADDLELKNLFIRFLIPNENITMNYITDFILNADIYYTNINDDLSNGMRRIIYPTYNDNHNDIYENINIVTN
jgi:hypothetical protein